MITSEMCLYPLYFASPLPPPPRRREHSNPGRGGKEGVTLKEDERQGRAAAPNTFPACEQMCPQGGRQLTNYVRAKRLAFGPGYHLCRQTVFNRNTEKRGGETSASPRAGVEMRRLSRRLPLGRATPRRVQVSFLSFRPGQAGRRVKMWWVHMAQPVFHRCTVTDGSP